MKTYGLDEAWRPNGGRQESVVKGGGIDRRTLLASVQHPSHGQNVLGHGGSVRGGHI